MDGLDMSKYQYRLIAANGFKNAWHDVTATETNGLAGIRLEFREKPSFEPGYFVDHSEVGPEHDYPYQVRWFDEEPVGEGWERAVVYNRHDDED